MAGNQGQMTKAEKIQRFLDRRRAEDLQRQNEALGIERTSGTDTDHYDDSQILLDIIPDVDEEAAFQSRLDEAMRESLLIYELQSSVDDTEGVAEQLQVEEVLHDSLMAALHHRQATRLTLDDQSSDVPSTDHGAVGGIAKEKCKKRKHLRKAAPAKKSVTRSGTDEDDSEHSVASSEDRCSSEDESCSSVELEEASEELQDVLKSRGEKSGRVGKKLTWLEKKKLRKNGGTASAGCSNGERGMELNVDVNPELAEVLQRQAESATCNRQGSRDDETDGNKESPSSTDQSDYRVEIECRLEPSNFADDELPETWQREITEGVNAHDGGSLNEYRLVPLSSGQMEYDAIVHEFSQVSLDVTSIERLQHPLLVTRYKIERDFVLGHRHSEYKLNERYLYHGTKAEKRLICEEGLDQRLSRTGHFGRGIYFSDNPRKCMCYSGKQKGTGPVQSSHILKCRVIMGDTKVYPNGESEPTLKKEPLRENPVGGWKYYDSVQGCPKDFNEFVIYEGRRAVTEYIIMYKQGCKPFTSPGAETGKESNSRDIADPVNKKYTLKWTRVSDKKSDNLETVDSATSNRTDEEKVSSEQNSLPNSVTGQASGTSSDSSKPATSSPVPEDLSDKDSVTSVSDDDKHSVISMSDDESMYESAENGIPPTRNADDVLLGAGLSSMGSGNSESAILNGASGLISHSTNSLLTSEQRNTIDSGNTDGSNTLRQQVAHLPAKQEDLIQSVTANDLTQVAMGTTLQITTSDPDQTISMVLEEVGGTESLAGDSSGPVLSANQQSEQTSENASSPADSAPLPLDPDETVPLDPDEAHRLRLERVREEIRRKRAERKLAQLAVTGGADHMAKLGQVQQALQKKKVTLGSSGATLDARTTNSLRQAFVQTYGNMTNVPVATVSAIPRSGAGNSDEVNPVEEVMSRLITEFLNVTNTDNISQARTHISQADMNLDLAIFNYYNSQA